MAAVAFILGGCSQQPTQQATGPANPGKPEVGVVTLHPQPVRITVELPGRTAASRVAQIRPQVDGIIQSVVFKEGSEVKAGDVLYQIDPQTYQAAYDSAAAALQKANAAVPNAEATVARYQRLAGVNSVTQAALGAAQATLLQAKADVAAAEAAQRAAKINLDFTKITAPIAGMIGTSSVTQGALVTAKQTDALATIRDIDTIYVDLTDSSTNLLHVRQMLSEGRLKGATLPLTTHILFEDGTTYPEPGKLTALDLTVSETTGTFSMRAEVPNPNHLLLPGAYLRAVVELGTIEGGFLVPQRAVSRNPKGQATAVFVGSDGKIVTRVLTTSQTIGESWLVEGGVADGDRLVVDGVQKVRDGQDVAAVEVRLDENGVAQPATGVSAPASSAPAAATR